MKKKIVYYTLEVIIGSSISPICDDWTRNIYKFSTLKEARKAKKECCWYSLDLPRENDIFITKNTREIVK